MTEREGACSETKAPPPPARKKPATVQFGAPCPYPYMGIRKRFVRLSYVITSKLSPGSLVRLEA